MAAPRRTFKDGTHFSDNFCSTKNDVTNYSSHAKHIRLSTILSTANCREKSRHRGETPHRSHHRDTNCHSHCHHRDNHHHHRNHHRHDHRHHHRSRSHNNSESDSSSDSSSVIIAIKRDTSTSQVNKTSVQLA